jgi:hypothetical protein
MNEIPSQTAEGPPIITVGELKAELSRLDISSGQDLVGNWAKS